MKKQVNNRIQVMSLDGKTEQVKVKVEQETLEQRITDLEHDYTHLAECLKNVNGARDDVHESDYKRILAFAAKLEKAEHNLNELDMRLSKLYVVDFALLSLIIMGYALTIFL